MMKKILSGVEFAKQGKSNHHRFRHSFASNLLRRGASIKQVQKLLGHEDIRTILDTYGHLMPDDLHRAVEMLSQPLEKASQTKYVRFSRKKVVNS